MGSEQEGAVVEHEEEREERGPMKISNPPEIDSDAQYLRAEPTEPSKTIDVIAAKAGDAGAVDDAAQSAEDISTDSLEVPDISGPGNGDGAHGSSLRRSCVGCTQARKKCQMEEIDEVTGERTCQRCFRFGLECEFIKPQKRGPKGPRKFALGLLPQESDVLGKRRKIVKPASLSAQSTENERRYSTGSVPVSEVAKAAANYKRSWNSPQGFPTSHGSPAAAQNNRLSALSAAASSVAANSGMSSAHSVGHRGYPKGPSSGYPAWQGYGNNGPAQPQRAGHGEIRLPETWEQDRRSEAWTYSRTVSAPTTISDSRSLPPLNTLPIPQQSFGAPQSWTYPAQWGPTSPFSAPRPSSPYGQPPTNAPAYAGQQKAPTGTPGYSGQHHLQQTKQQHPGPPYPTAAQIAGGRYYSRTPPAQAQQQPGPGQPDYFSFSPYHPDGPSYPVFPPVPGGYERPPSGAGYHERRHSGHGYEPRMAMATTPAWDMQDGQRQQQEFP